MAEEEAFFTQSVDRTPYGSCGLLAAVIFVFFLAGTWSLWRVSGFVKRHVSLHIPALPGQSDGSNLIEQVKDAAGTSAATAKDSATETVKKAAREEAQKQLDTQIQAAKDAASHQLQSITSHE